MISILIPVRNGGGDLRRCLDAVARQKVDDEVETIIVDHHSSDGTPEFARSRGAHVLEIGPTEFGHGSTRNLAAREARGEILVFTVQDAHAEDELWLSRLCGALEGNEMLAGVYGRQIPHDGASPPEEFFLNFLYGPKPRVQRADSPADLSMQTALFSNVNSAIRRDVWEQFPFADDLFMAEDQDWARRVLLEGYALRYEPAAAVRHSHTYTVANAYRRFFDTGASADRGFLAGGTTSSAVLRKEALRYAREELAWLARTGRRRWIPYTALYESAKFVGLQLGARHRHLPLWLKRRSSLFPDYWDTVASGAVFGGQTASAQKTNAASESGSDSR